MRIGISKSFGLSQIKEFGATVIATQQLLINYPDKWTRFSDQYRPSQKMQNRTLVAVG